MVAPRAQNKFLQVLPYIFSALTFLGGWYMSFLSSSYKVDNLTMMITGLTNAVNTLTSKLENNSALYNNLDKRVSIIEMRNELKPAQVSVSNEQKQN
ncbi:hypothetical protein IDJ77_11170 [Mucilaginibacter sp. ZT4R22]|uniref:Uncharacterized protein n=1 Tax=Mucilaginibacter pankratovii TaxID=2772110 RepID=A0ABR7WSJ9_9SPHI|nr:hypothetical protein [Mucilaginibacter pankratovii]MBD1364369.1 hypothetical protein [Mucilaginibacter pankratovii]